MRPATRRPDPPARDLTVDHGPGTRHRWGDALEQHRPGHDAGRTGGSSGLSATPYWRGSSGPCVTGVGDGRHRWRRGFDPLDCGDWSWPDRSVWVSGCSRCRRSPPPPIRLTQEHRATRARALDRRARPRRQAPRRPRRPRLRRRRQPHRRRRPPRRPHRRRSRRRHPDRRHPPIRPPPRSRRLPPIRRRTRRRSRPPARRPRPSRRRSSRHPR
jgi:hypothetical protein